MPDDARDELAARAVRAGQSLEEHLRVALTELTRRPDPGTLMDHVRERKASTNAVLAADEMLSATLVGDARVSWRQRA